MRIRRPTVAQLAAAVDAQVVPDVEPDRFGKWARWFREWSRE